MRKESLMTSRGVITQERCDHNNGAIRNCKSKDQQHNGQQKTNTIYKTLHRRKLKSGQHDSHNKGLNYSGSLRELEASAPLVAPGVIIYIVIQWLLLERGSSK